MANKICPKCQQEYSDTYRKCPFCEEEARLAKGKPLRRGGKHAEKRKNPGGAGGIMLLLTVVIIAGVLSYVFFGDEIAGFLGIRREDDLSGSQGSDVLPPDDGGGDTGAQGGQGEQTPPPGPDDGGTGGDGGGQDQTPADPVPLKLESPDKFTIPAGETGRIAVSGGTGDVVWTSSNEEIATVDGGAVTGIRNGTVTITAAAGEESVTCEVTVTGGEDWVSPVTYKLSTTDFTISNDHPNPVTVRISPEGYTSAVWSIDKPEVATVDASGKVTRVGKGTATLTCVVDGQTLTCIVRCS